MGRTGARRDGRWQPHLDEVQARIRPLPHHHDRRDVGDRVAGLCGDWVIRCPYREGMAGMETCPTFVGGAPPLICVGSNRLSGSLAQGVANGQNG